VRPLDPSQRGTSKLMYVCTYCRNNLLQYDTHDYTLDEMGRLLAGRLRRYRNTDTLDYQYAGDGLVGEGGGGRHEWNIM
jgi:hypothetical protein